MSLLHPELDIEARVPIWDSMQMIYMDTDPQSELEGIAIVCAQSKYTIDELGEILFNEVRPAAQFNLGLIPAPEWRGFETQWLKERIIETHKFGKPKPKFFARYTKEWWNKLVPLIEEKRENA